MEKTEILLGAINIFAEYGYEKTKIIDISKHLNISTSVLYRHFDSKYNLYEEAISHCLNTVDEHLDKLSNEVSSLHDYLVAIIHLAKEISQDDQKRVLLNFYMLITTNTLEIKNTHILENFELNKLQRYSKFLTTDDTPNKYRLLFIDNVINLYIYSFFNEFYAEKMKLYFASVSNIDEEKFEENLINYLLMSTPF